MTPAVSGWATSLVRQRAWAQRSILLVVTGVALLAAALLCALAVTASATSHYAVPTALGRLDPEQTGWQVSIDFRTSDVQAAREATDAVEQDVFRDTPRAAAETLESGIIAVPGSSLDAYFFLSSVDGIHEHVTLSSGRWPEPARAGAADHPTVVEIVVPSSAAQVLHLRVGSVVPGHLFNGRFDTRMRVVGVYAVDDPDADIWADDRFSGSTYDPAYVVPFTNATLTTDAFGPVIVDKAGFTLGVVPAGQYSRAVQPDLSALTAGELGPLRARLATAEHMLPSTYPDASTASIDSELPQTLERIERFVFVTSSTVLIASSMLVLLALVALALATRLLRERRLAEQSLVRARGASTRQVVAVATVEAGLIGAACLVLGPPLARWLFLAIAHRDEMEAAGLAQDPGLPWPAWAASAVAALLVVGALVLPLLGRSSSFVEREGAAARQAVGAIQRSGIDLAVLALAALAYHQLRTYQSPLVTDATGQLRLDPILMAGPALCLLAGTLVALRLLPLLARSAELLAGHGRSIVAALAAWEVSRRSQRAIGAVLLLTMALAVGTFGLTYLDTWRQSQTDQADAAVGVDGRISDLAHAALAESGAVAGLDGTADSMPVTFNAAQLVPDADFSFNNPTASGPDIRLVAADVERLPSFLRGALNASPRVDASLAQLESPAPIEGFELPGSPTRLSARVRVERPEVQGGVTMILRAALEDVRGVREVVELGRVPADDAGHRVSVALMGVDSRGEDEAADGFRPAAPLRLIALQGFLVGDETQAGQDGGFHVDIRVDRVRVEQPSGPARPVRFPVTTWVGTPTITPVEYFTQTIAGWVTGKAGGGVALEGYVQASVEALDAGVGAAWLSWERGRDVPVVASDAALSASGMEVGDYGFVLTDAGFFGVRIAASSDYVPGTGSGEAAVIADYDTLTRTQVERGGSGRLTDEWWTTVPDDQAQAYVDAAQAADLGTVVARIVLADQSRTDPLRIGIQAALWLVVAAAAALAASGFAMHATVTIRQRRVEFSELRALGMTRRALTGVVALENLLLCLLGIAFGIGLGVLVASLVAPLVSLTAAGGMPVPPITVHVPWSPVLRLAAEVVLLLMAVVGVVALALRRSALGAVLRIGDER